MMGGAGPLRRLAMALCCICWPVLAFAQTISLTETTVPELMQVQATATPAPAPAPVADPPRQAVAMGVLVLDVDQAYGASAWGRRAQGDLEAAAREIEAENVRLEDQLTAEEQALTAERDSLPPAEFRARAEAFDIRAQNIRRERRQVAVDLGSRAQADRNAFLEATLPVIAAIMQERNAGVVLDRRQTLAAINAVDITEELVLRMDETIGDGGSLPDLPVPEVVTPPAE